MRNLSILIVLAVLIIHFNCFGGEITTQEFVDKLNINASTFCDPKNHPKSVDLETCEYRAKLAMYACTSNCYYIMPDTISETKRKKWSLYVSECLSKVMKTLYEIDHI